MGKKKEHTSGKTGEKVRCERHKERSERRPGRKRCNKKYNVEILATREKGK
jgi:hypothetical protein